LNSCEGSLPTASAFFESGGSVDPVTGRLKNILTGATAASNVSLQLRDGSSTTRAVIQAGNQNQRLNTAYVAYTGSPTGSANLPYFVEYYADGTGSITGGKIQSTVIYSIQYK
jgi:major type 1 subunit fimbrin (pilin)